MYDVICVGSALLDIFVKSEKFKKIPSGEYADGVALCEEYGGKTEVEEMGVASGGGGTNTAVSFAKKGLKTALIAEVGRDLVAGAIKQELVREDVDLMMLAEVEGEKTGMSVILVAPDGGRSAMIARGAAKMLTNEDVKWESLNTKWLYVSALGGELWLLQSLIGHAREHGIKIALNPGMGEIEKMKNQDSGFKLQDSLSGVEVLMMNREEAAGLLGLPLEEEAAWRGTWGIPGPHWVVVTDGKNGGVVMGEEKQIFFEAEKTEVVEETGAGDAFGSGLVYALTQGKDIETAINWGKKQAASVVSFMGAKQGLLTVDAIASWCYNAKYGTEVYSDHNSFA